MRRRRRRGAAHQHLLEFALTLYGIDLYAEVRNFDESY